MTAGARRNASGSRLPRSTRGSSRSESVFAAPRLSRSTFRKTCADAIATRRVQRRDAQRLPQLVDQARRLVPRAEQRGDRPVVDEPPADLLRARHQRRDRDTLVDRQPARGDDHRHEMPRRAMRRRAQRQAVRRDEMQRRAFERGVEVDLETLQQRQRLAIRADQDVLAVVERDLPSVRGDPRHAPRAAAERARSLEQRDVHAGIGEMRGGREPGPASADDGDALRGRAHRPGATHVRHAIHSLRIGVSEMRWFSTAKSARSISSSTAR